MASTSPPPPTTTPARLRRVLSIQSAVVHGVVGNRASTLALQLAGLDVDALNMV